MYAASTSRVLRALRVIATDAFERLEGLHEVALVLVRSTARQEQARKGRCWFGDETLCVQRVECGAEN